MTDSCGSNTSGHLYQTNLTNHGVLIGAAGGVLNSIAAGTTGQVLTGNTGADPSFAAATNVGTVTQFDVLVGGAAGAIASVGPGSSGQYLQSSGNAANPAYSTATLPSTATGTGTILRADGTNWSATTATYPNTITASNLLYSNGANTITGLATANNALLTTNGSGVPAVSTTGIAQMTALGVGAAAGASGITFPAAGGSGTPASDTLRFYESGTWTPIIAGAATAGTTTYTLQQGQYIKIGRLVMASFQITYSAATGTGNVQLQGLPFVLDNDTGTIFPIGVVLTANVVYPAGTTYVTLLGANNTTLATFYGCGTGVANAAVQMANSSLGWYGNLTYIATT